MDVKPTAENRPAWVPPGSVFCRRLDSDATYEDKGGVQAIVALLSIGMVELSRFPAVYSEEVGARVIGPQWIEEFFKGRLEAV